MAGSVVGFLIVTIIGLHEIETIDLKAMAPVLSAVAAAGSCYVAWQVRKSNEQKSEAKFKSDLYCVVAQLSSMVNFFQNLYDIHSTIHSVDIKRIVEMVKNIDKNILDTTGGFFYNDKFDESVLCAINLFIEEYNSWKGFRVINSTEILMEFEKICNLKVRALEVIKAIQVTVNNPKVSKILKQEVYELDELLHNFETERASIQYAAGNVYILFLLPVYRSRYSKEDQENIVLHMVKCFLSGRIEKEPYLKEKKYVFMTENIDEQSFDINEMKSFLDSLNVSVDH